MIKLNAIINIDIKYKKLIRLWFDLYQDKNSRDNRINRAAAIPQLIVIMEILIIVSQQLFQNCWKIKRPIKAANIHSEVNEITQKALAFNVLSSRATLIELYIFSFSILSTKIRLVNILIFLHDLILYILAMISVFGILLQMIYVDLLTCKDLVIWFNVCDIPQK